MDPRFRPGFIAIGAFFGLSLAACGDMARLPPASSEGPNPTLPPPTRTLLPTVNVAPAKGWPQDAMPQPAPGLRVTAFARELDHPRWLLALPNGDVLVAESKAPERPEQGKGIKAKFVQFFMKRAGAGGPSANRITLLRDADGDGVAEERHVFAEGLNSPFGMALVGSSLYVANTDGIVRFEYEAGATSAQGAPQPVTDLPGGPLNHHWTKNIIANREGTRLYATVGSNSDVAENGMDKEEGRAAIWEVDPSNGSKRLFATGLRNPNGMAWSSSGVLWTVVNERDELGSDLVPDYLTSVSDGGFYGWPYSYFGQHVDERVKPARPDLVATAKVPEYALGNHVAPLGLVSSAGNQLPAPFGAEGMFIGQHGSWNRRPHSGYKVVFVPFQEGRPSGAPPVDVLTGFLSSSDEALGRPVGVAIDARGALLVSDDVGNAVWRVSAP